MTNLTRAHRQLFARPPDERFETITALTTFCQDLKDRSFRYKEPGPSFSPVLHEGALALRVNGLPPFRMNDWSFTQLCALAGVAKDTLNRLQPDTAAQVFTETLGERVDSDTDLQALVLDNRMVRAINGSQYKRLWSADLLALVQEFATDFTPPQKGFNGATGLYAGEQDLFVFLIDATGWIEIGNQAFAPGFFLWNSEVGKRTVGVSTFWFQAICCNHIVWDAVEVTEFTRKHTGSVKESLTAIRRFIEALVQKRDERQDGFAKVIAKAMKTSFGKDAEEVLKQLTKAGFTRLVAQKALEIAQDTGRFTLWSVVDALTQLARQQPFAGSRTELDQKASALLKLATK